MEPISYHFFHRCRQFYSKKKVIAKKNKPTIVHVNDNNIEYYRKEAETIFKNADIIYDFGFHPLKSNV